MPVVDGVILAAAGNTLPKLVRPLSERADAARALAAERFAALPKPMVLHPASEVSATRLVSALSAVNAVSDAPKLALE